MGFRVDWAKRERVRARGKKMRRIRVFTLYREKEHGGEDGVFLNAMRKRLKKKRAKCLLTQCPT